jgi:hypothetical protein
MSDGGGERQTGVLAGWFGHRSGKTEGTMRARVLVLVALTGAVLPSCSSSPPALKDALVGKWQQVDGKREVLEFFKDGTVATYYQEGNTRKEELVGTYTVVDADRVKIQFNGRDPYLSRVTISGDELTQRLPPKDEVIKFRRVK